MKRFLFLVQSTIFFLMLGHRVSATPLPGLSIPSKHEKGYVEVIYFHGKQRCVTCQSIEQQTRNLLQEKYAKQMKTGNIKFRVIDFSQGTGKKVADKYGVTWSSIFVVLHKEGKEEVQDLTQFAFRYARKAADRFKKGLAEKIDQAVK